ncbi:putative transcriptional regulatory protein for hcr operon [alpha proteobacterium Q-1]|nr:putative transcriptional regulatory protein for hcr operon [alpha proteobacterium Q-1]
MPPKQVRKKAQTLDFSSLDDLFGFRLRLAQVKLFQHFRESLAPLQITPGQAGLLILIRDNPGISQSDLARAMQVERATLGQTIEGLVRRDFIVRNPRPGDRRAYSLSLSAAGDAFVDQLIPAIRAHEADVSQKLTAIEFDRLRSLLQKFNG